MGKEGKQGPFWEEDGKKIANIFLFGITYFLIFALVKAKKILKSGIYQEINHAY